YVPRRYVVGALDGNASIERDGDQPRGSVLRDRDPEDDGDDDRDRLQGKVVRDEAADVDPPAQPGGPRALDRAHGQDALLRKGSGWMRLRSNDERTRRRRSSSRPPIMRPFDAIEIACVSSETTTTTASVCELTDSAAR